MIDIYLRIDKAGVILVKLFTNFPYLQITIRYIKHVFVLFCFVLVFVVVVVVVIVFFKLLLIANS